MKAKPARPNVCWDRFYKHQTRPYQDRHWLWAFLPEIFPIPPSHYWGEILVRKFVCPYCGQALAIDNPCIHVPEYQSSVDLTLGNLKHVHVPFAAPKPPFLHVLDVGCGTGSTVFPLLEKNGAVHATVFDYSPNAIEWLRQRPFFDAERLAVSVDDACSFSLAESFDFVLLIFVLSSIPDFLLALQRCKAHLKYAGVLCIIDYTLHDDKVTRRAGREIPGGVLCERAGDATTLIGFDAEQLCGIITEMGMTVYELCIHQRQEKNRKTGFEFIRSQFIIKCGLPRPE